LLPMPVEVIGRSPDVAQQVRRGMDQVDGGLLAAALSADKARKHPVGQVEGGGDGLGNGNHGYDHPYVDGSRFVFHDPRMAGAKPNFQLKLSGHA
jgi:hypothetical protein